MEGHRTRTTTMLGIRDKVSNPSNLWDLSGAQTMVWLAQTS
jgi:hypothetical protein